MWVAAGNPSMPTAREVQSLILNYTDSSTACPAPLWGGLRLLQGLGIMPWALLSPACHLPVSDVYFLPYLLFQF